MDPARALMDQLIARRKELGLSQAQIAGMIGTTQSAISDMEKRPNPTLGVLLRYADAVGMQGLFLPCENGQKWRSWI